MVNLSLGAGLKKLVFTRNSCYIHDMKIHRITSSNLMPEPTTNQDVVLVRACDKSVWLFTWDANTQSWHYEGSRPDENKTLAMVT